MTFQIGDMVEWTWVGGHERGTVECIADGCVTVDYGPWSDKMTLTSEEAGRVLRMVERAVLS